jgi:hypothetical protein
MRIALMVILALVLVSCAHTEQMGPQRAEACRTANWSWVGANVVDIGLSLAGVPPVASLAHTAAEVTVCPPSSPGQVPTGVEP